MSDRVYIARPGDEEAAAAINKRRTSDPSQALLTIALPIYILLSLGVSPHVFTIIFLATAAPLVTWTLYRFLKPRKSPLQQALEDGNVIAVDSYLIEAWDAIRQRLGVKLSRQERQNAMRHLFGVAGELAPKLARYHELEEEPELTDEREETEAYIRARLLPEVRELAAYQSGVHELNSSKQLELPTVDPEDVAAELAILRAERNKALPPGQE